MLLMAVAAAFGQEAKVKRVEPSPMDLSASKYQRLDLNGKACALVRVEVLADDVEFFGDVVNPVEHKTGDYWVYMPGGSKMLQIKSRSFLPLFINFDDYGIKALQPMVTYVITLSLPAGAVQQQSATSGRNYLVMNVSPANAKVTVEGVEREVRDGKVKTLLRHGTYSYHVEAPGYLPEDGRVNVGSDRAELTVALRSTKGTLAVSTTTPGTEIYVNGDRMGVGSWSGEMFPDTYAIEGRLAGHRNAEQVVTVATGQTATVTLPALIPITGSLNIDYEPVGASITIDGTASGTTPAVIDNLLVGTHSVTIAADCHTPQTLTATISDSEMATLTGSLTKAATNLIRFHDQTSKKYGYKDENGNIVIPAKYDDALDFSDGLALVKFKGKCGFIDKTDKLVIPAKYDSAWPFSDGLALVEINGKYGFIDKTDKLVIPAKYDSAWPFSEGLALVKIKGKYGFIDKAGKQVTPVKYDDAWSFSDGLALVKIKGKCGFIDKAGKQVTPVKYDDAWSFSDGLALVKIKGKYGFIDKTDKLVIPAKYDDAWWFKNGKAKVTLNGREFYIDKNGNEVK